VVGKFRPDKSIQAGKSVFLCRGQRKISPGRKFWAKIHGGPLDSMNNNSLFCDFWVMSTKIAFSMEFSSVGDRWCLGLLKNCSTKICIMLYAPKLSTNHLHPLFISIFRHNLTKMKGVSHHIF
jgi:hypothetical protein